MQAAFLAAAAWSGWMLYRTRSSWLAELPDRDRGILYGALATALLTLVGRGQFEEIGGGIRAVDRGVGRMRFRRILGVARIAPLLLLTGASPLHENHRVCRMFLLTLRRLAGRFPTGGSVTFGCPLAAQAKILRARLADGPAFGRGRLATSLALALITALAILAIHVASAPASIAGAERSDGGVAGVLQGRHRARRQPRLGRPPRQGRRQEARARAAARAAPAAKTAARRATRAAARRARAARRAARAAKRAAAKAKARARAKARAARAEAPEVASNRPRRPAAVRIRAATASPAALPPGSPAASPASRRPVERPASERSVRGHRAAAGRASERRRQCGSQERAQEQEQQKDPLSQRLRLSAPRRGEVAGVAARLARSGATNRAGVRRRLRRRRFERPVESCRAGRGRREEPGFGRWFGRRFG